jgi:hypothetical protein
MREGILHPLRGRRSGRGIQGQAARRPTAGSGKHRGFAQRKSEAPTGSAIAAPGGQTCTCSSPNRLPSPLGVRDTASTRRCDGAAGGWLVARPPRAFRNALLRYLPPSCRRPRRPAENRPNGTRRPTDVAPAATERPWAAIAALLSSRQSPEDKYVSGRAPIEKTRVPPCRRWDARRGNMASLGGRPLRWLCPGRSQRGESSGQLAVYRTPTPTWLPEIVTHWTMPPLA